MNNLTRFFKTPYVSEEPRNLLLEKIDALLGVSQEARQALEPLKILNVFDLATSAIFNNAQEIARGSAAESTLYTRFGQMSADMVDTDDSGEDVTQLAFQPIEVLDGIGPGNGPAIESALDVVTVLDLANWPPFRNARQIVQQTLLPESTQAFDPEAPPDLLPKTGEYPTEKVFYNVVVLDRIEDTPSVQLDGHPVDIGALTNSSDGFTKPATGAILTYEQAWFAQGVSLGNLLHSVALAPGESTRIAIVDWARQTSSQTGESIDQIESLSNTTAHNRSISEVTSAVADESQQGFSSVGSTNTSFQRGRSTGSGIVAGVGAGGGGGAGAAGGGIGGGVGGGSFQGDSTAFAQNIATATSVSSSSGRRSLFGDMAQNVADSTQQHANSARNRRASIVSEVSQSEQETLTTRAITNFNHMHALSIQYYEVVQIYRMSVRVSKVDKCLFVPMKLIVRWRVDLVERYRPILIAFALNERIRRALAEGAGAVTITPVLPYFDSRYWQGAGSLRILLEEQLECARELTGQLLATDIFLPWSLAGPIQLSGVSIGNDNIDRILISTVAESLELNRESGSNGWRGDLSTPVLLNEVQSVAIELSSDHIPNISGSINLILHLIDLTGTVFDHQLKLDTAEQIFDESSQTLRVELLTLSYNADYDALLRHLDRNSLYYSQAVWMQMDSATMALLLSPYTYNGRPLMEQIDMQPVSVTGNYLIFRLNVNENDQKEKEAWNNWLSDHGFDDANVAKHEIVPLPSGGVFAEAVLGRFNSAEKLDITRFWDWQDSPIPITAPDIAPLTTGDKTQDLTAAPGRLDNPLVNIVNPTSLPDPQTFQAMANALTTSNMFRDMSGLAQVIALAQSGLETTSTAATAAGQQAGTNMATAANAVVEAYKAALNLAGSFAGMGIEGMNSSKAGAAINAAKAADKNRGGTNGGGGTGGGNGGQGATGSGSGGGEPVGPAGGLSTLTEDTIQRWISPGPLNPPSLDGLGTDTGSGGDSDGTGSDDDEDEGDEEGESSTIRTITSPGVVPQPALFAFAESGLTEPALGLLSAYFSQYEGDDRIPPEADRFFRFGAAQDQGLKLRHHVLELYLSSGVPLNIDDLYAHAKLRSGDSPGIAGLVCHNVMRTFARGGKFETMALPWEREAHGMVPEHEGNWVDYTAGVPDTDAQVALYRYQFDQGDTPDALFLRETENGPRPSGFYKLFNADALGYDDPGDWYHFFLMHTITSLHVTQSVRDELGLSSGSSAAQKAYTVAGYGLLKTLRRLLRSYHDLDATQLQGVEHIYDGWLWANAMSLVEGLNYGHNQSEVSRESVLHMQGAVRGIDDTIGITSLTTDGGMPIWRWVVPNLQIKAKINFIREKLEFAQEMTTTGQFDLAGILGQIDDLLNLDLGGIDDYISDLLDMNGDSVMAAESAPPEVFTRTQHKPAAGEAASSGPLGDAILPNTPEYNTLLLNSNPDIVYKNTGDHPMTERLRNRIDALSERVKTEFSGYRLRITSTWRQKPDSFEYRSLHWEGRAVDFNIIADDPNIIESGDYDKSKLGRAAQLAYDVGFDWVWYENSFHVHASVKPG